MTEQHNHDMDPADYKSAGLMRRESPFNGTWLVLGGPRCCQTSFSVHPLPNPPLIRIQGFCLSPGSYSWASPSVAPPPSDLSVSLPPSLTPVSRAQWKHSRWRKEDFKSECGQLTSAQVFYKMLGITIISPSNRRASLSKSLQQNFCTSTSSSASSLTDHLTVNFPSTLLSTVRIKDLPRGTSHGE